MKYLLIFWAVTSLVWFGARWKLSHYDRTAQPPPWNPDRWDVLMIAGVILAVLPGFLLECLYEVLMMDVRKEAAERAWQEKLQRGC